MGQLTGEPIALKQGTVALEGMASPACGNGNQDSEDLCEGTSRRNALTFCLFIVNGIFM
jgi:hypothetical protein